MERGIDCKDLESHSLLDAENRQALNRISQRNRNKTKRVADITATFKDLYNPTGQILGYGAIASVQTFTNSFSSREYAVKIIKKSKIQSCRKILNEINIFHLCQGQENILQLHEYFEEDDRFYLVFDKMLGGTLSQTMKRRGHLTEMEASKIVLSIATALEFLHNKGIAHRDLKLANILCEGKEDILPVRICDFDLASDVPLGIQTDLCSTPILLSPVGTPMYLAPEVVDSWIDPSFLYDKKCDLWSLGIIMYIMLCGYPPFNGDCGGDCGLNRYLFCQDCQDLLFDSIKNDVCEFPNDEWSLISDSAKDLIQHLLVRDPYKRYSAKQVLNHPWVYCPPTITPLATPTTLSRNGSPSDLESFTNTAVSINRMLNQCRITNEPLEFRKNDTEQETESDGINSKEMW